MLHCTTPVEVFPLLRFPAPSESEKRQEQVSNAVREVVNLDAPLGQVLAGNASFIFGIPELDPYRHLRASDQYVSIHITPIPSNLYSKDGTAWAYLSDNYPHRNLVLNTLKPQCDFKPLTEVLARKSLAIHHGGLTTAIACLLAGIPQLVFPIYLEQQLNAMVLSQLGVAIFATPTWEGLVMAQAQASALAGIAKQKAENLADWNQNFMSVIVKTSLEFLALPNLL